MAIFRNIDVEEPASQNLDREIRVKR